MFKKAEIFPILFSIFISLFGNLLFNFQGTFDLAAQVNWTHISSATGDLPVPGPNHQTAALILDINNDGLNDFVIGCRRSGPAITWFKRTGSGWERYEIEPNFFSIEAGGAFADIDGDGDLDVVAGEDHSGNRVFWWENPYPNFDPNIAWTRREIKNSGANKHHDIIFGDFDGDGQEELVFWNQGADKLFLAEIPSNPHNTSPWSYTEIYSGNGEGLAKGDIDGDGKTDLLAAGRWFKHTGGLNFTPHVIDNSQHASRIAVGDLIPGGYPEVAMVEGDGEGPLKWYQCIGNPANPSDWVGHDLLGYNVFHGHSLEIADFNGDGHLDIFCGEMILDVNSDARVWVFLGDGNGNFTETVVSTGIEVHESKVGDLDGDGDVDILGKPYNWNTPRLDVWLNETNGTGQLPLDSWQRHVIDPAKPWRTIFISAADLNGDGLKDIITGGWWYENPGTAGGSWTRHTIGPPLNNFATATDFDGDGDIDILGTQGQGSSNNSDFAWARNEGAGTFTVLTNISSGNGDFLQGVAIDRFQVGGPLQIALSWHAAGMGVQMLTVPAEPSTTTWQWQVISPESQDECLSSGDIDNDGDPDLLLGTKWLRNDNGSWTLFTLNNSGGSPDRNRLADINQDGKLDAVVGFEATGAPGKFVWYEQPADPTGTWPEHHISQSVVGPMSLDVADLDGDGDLDVVVGEHNRNNPSAARMLIFENADGQGGNWVSHLVYTGEEHHDGARLVDIDNDGDLDIISIGWDNPRVVLYENLAISSGPSAPIITGQPQNVTVLVGQTASFTVTATGVPPLTYQWQRNQVDIPGATQSTYTLPQATLADNGALFRCIVSNSYGSVTSREAMLTVLDTTQGGRVSANLLALYLFEEGTGTIIHDISGTGTPVDLTILNPGSVQWLTGAISLTGNTLISSITPPIKIIDSCMASNEISVEVWIKPSSANQAGPARIVTLSSDPYNRNFTLGQQASDYNFRLRTTTTGNNGTNPSLTAPGVTTSSVSQVVYTRNSSGQAKLYINGSEVASAAISGDFSNWDASYLLALGNELTGDRPWQGQIHLLAIYNRALQPDEIYQNFSAGPNGNINSSDDPQGNIPENFWLKQNYPNPFNSTTTIEFQIPDTGQGNLQIFDVLGNKVATLLKGRLTAGEHRVQWRAEGLPSGLYFYRLQWENYSLARKMLLLQ